MEQLLQIIANSQKTGKPIITTDFNLAIKDRETQKLFIKGFTLVAGGLIVGSLISGLIQTYGKGK